MTNAKLQHYFLLLLLLGALLLTFFVFYPFLAPLAFAAVFAVIFQPLYRWLLARMGGGWPGLAALATVILSAVCILLPLTLLGVQIVREAQALYASLADGSGLAYLEALAERLPQVREYLGDVSADIDTYVRQALSWLIQNTGAAFTGIAGLFLDFFIFFIALFYLLRDGARFKRAIIKLSPLADTDDEAVFGRLELAINSVVKGNLAIAIIQGLLTAIGFAIFGVPNFVLWGTATAIAALIPGVGTALVIVPAIVYLFLTGHNLQGFGLLAWGVVAVGLIDNFLGPRLIGAGVKLHPLLILLAVLGGIALFGPLGIFLGPLCVSLLFALLSIYSYATGQGAAGGRSLSG